MIFLFFAKICFFFKEKHLSKEVIDKTFTDLKNTRKIKINKRQN